MTPSVTVTWNSIAGAGDYEIEAIPSGDPAGCAAAGAFCGNCNSLGGCGTSGSNRTWTFEPTRSNYTIHVRGVNVACYGVTSQVYRSAWSSDVGILIVAPIWGRVYYDGNATASVVSGICQSSDPSVIGTSGGATAVIYQDTSSGYSNGGAVAPDGGYIGYMPLDTTGDIMATLNLPSSPYLCSCPANCVYGGIRAPHDNVNFYIQNVRDAWFQVIGGPIATLANSGTVLWDPIPTSCSGPNCIPYLIARLSAAVTGSSGYALTGGGAIDLRNDNGNQATEIDQDGRNMIGQTGTGLSQYTYSYFRSLYDFPETIQSDFGGSNPANDAQEPTGAGVNNVGAFYYDGSQGALTIQDPWTIAADESRVIFVNGDLNINNTIDVANTGFLAFFVTGTITVDSSVGHVVTSGVPPATTGVVEGVYVADGQIIIESLGAGNGDRRFVGEGTFVGWGGISLLRNFDDGTATGLMNGEYPAEIFRYRPDFVLNTPGTLRVPNYVWSEINP